MIEPKVPVQSERLYAIHGGNPIVGEITCLGAKNFATKAMVAALLGDSPTRLTNVPPIGDVAITEEMIQAIGALVDRNGDEMIIDPRHMGSSSVPMPHSGTNRIPILLLGALLHRHESVAVPFVGGCKIGARTVDFHLQAIESFGGTVEETEEGYIAHRNGRLRGARIELPYPSVGATETCLFLGVLARGRTMIANAAIEPEIMDLITMLQAMGAIIYTSSGRDIRIEGVDELSGTWMRCLGDRIEAASWACLACASNGNIVVRGIRPDTLGNFLSRYQAIGGGIQLVDADAIRFFRRTRLVSTILETDVYPGFSTDWQQPFAVLLTQAEGTSVIHETVYENRFGYLTALNALGARTQTTSHCLGSVPCRYRDADHQHSAIIMGPTRLQGGSHIRIPDLRAGLAYVIAAAVAEGETKVSGVDYLERGYGDIVPRLRQLDLPIELLTGDLAPLG